MEGVDEDKTVAASAADNTLLVGKEQVVANIAVIGAGWWSQGWHLPCLDNNPHAKIIAIVDTSHHPRSNLNPDLEPLDSLQERYDTRIYSSMEDLMNDTNVSSMLDGVVIATPHATHYDVAQKILCRSNEEKPYQPIHILMEKPMSTNIQHALDLFKLVERQRDTMNSTDENSLETTTTMKATAGSFWVNHSANFRIQTKMARDAIVSGKIGRVRHITAFFASPLQWIFDDPTNTGWNEPTDEMLGNGFAWGQSSHLFAWIYHVCPMVRPMEVFCTMTHSEKTGADVSHSATIRCCTDKEGMIMVNNEDGTNTNKDHHDVILSVSGTTLLPGNAHSDPPVAKEVQIQIFGSDGCLLYMGNDRDPESGRLELRKADGSIEVLYESFDFENLDNEGLGPESLQNFVRLCRGGTTTDSSDDGYNSGVYAGATVKDGLRSVQTIDAMYRSHVSFQPEKVLHPE